MENIEVRDLQTQINKLLVEEDIKGYRNSEHYINLAIWAMEAGYSSINLDILAGLDNSEVLEIDKYFQRVVDDFELDIHIEISKLLDFFLVYKIREVLSNPNLLDEIIPILDDTVDRTSYWNNIHLDFLFCYYESKEKNREKYALNELEAFINELDNKN